MPANLDSAIASSISPDDLQALADNINQLSPAERVRLQAILSQRNRGFRTNRWIQAIRPSVHPKQALFLSLEHREVLYGGSAGCGKAMLICTVHNMKCMGFDPDSKSSRAEFVGKYGQSVLTPFGFKLIDDIRAGDAVCNPDGTVSNVVLVHQPMRRPCYEIEFSDGAKCIVASDHLWSVKISGYRTRRKVADPYAQFDSDVLAEFNTPQARFNMELMRRYKTMTTTDLEHAFRRAEQEERDGNRPHWPSIPVTEPTVMTLPKGKTAMCPPYTLGVMLGDGHMANTRWEKPDYFLADEIRKELQFHEIRDLVTDHADGEGHGITGGYIANCIRSLGLSDAVSYTKFIPKQYLHGSIELRLSLVQGLLDTDGYVSETGHCYYSSSSLQLAKDLQFVLRSLGYTATLTTKDEPVYEYQGEKCVGRPSHMLYITGRNKKDLFRLPRKRDLIQESNNECGRRVVRMTKLEHELDTQCITVSHPNGLYLTNDFIVTHNSDALLLAAMQYLDVPGYSAILFRRTFVDLNQSGALMDRAKQWFMNTDAKWSAKDRSFYFPTAPGKDPSRLAFAYIADENDIYNYQGAEFTFCTARGTRIVMADGSLKPVESLAVGDLVRTPEGDRPISAVFPGRMAKCVRAIVRGPDGDILGEQVQTLDHGFMAEDGSWTTYSKQFEPSESIECRATCKHASRSPSQFHVASAVHDTRYEDRSQHLSLSEHRSWSHISQEIFASSASEETDFESFGDGNRATWQPVLSCVPARLFLRHLRSVDPLSPLRGASHAGSSSLAVDFRCDCQTCFRSGGEQLHHHEAPFRCESTFVIGAEVPTVRFYSWDDFCTSPQHSPPDSKTWFHPRLKETDASPFQSCVFLASAETVRKSHWSTPQAVCTHPQFGEASEHPRLLCQTVQYEHPYAARMVESSEYSAGGSLEFLEECEAEVFDIRVAGASCYITEFGVCNQNCGFDELTQHPFKSYSYLFSRLRRLKGSSIPIRIRASTNPGGKFGEWVKENFITEEYLKSSPYEQANGVWQKKTECHECGETGFMNGEECIYCEGVGYRSRYFVPARLMDNPSLDRAEYSRSLIELSPVERHRLENGDWSITEQGERFRMEWVRYYSRNGDHFRLHRPDQNDLVIEIGSLMFFVTADTASKEKTMADFTCISTWAFHSKTGSLLLISVTMAKLEVPKIADTILSVSHANKKTLFVMIEDAQCGIGVIQELRGPKGKGMAVLPYLPGTHDKVDRSTTAQVKMESGQIYFPSGRPGWLDAPTAQMIGFPEAPHDDFVDTLSMAASWAHSRHQHNSLELPGELPPIGR